MKFKVEQNITSAARKIITIGGIKYLYLVEDKKLVL
jgi:hypothetical protein